MYRSIIKCAHVMPNWAYILTVTKVRIYVNKSVIDGSFGNKS